jgi:hypothetical protein
VTTVFAFQLAGVLNEFFARRAETERQFLKGFVLHGARQVQLGGQL